LAKRRGDAAPEQLAEFVEIFGSEILLEASLDEFIDVDLDCG
jgi:hypothetical protein